MSQANATIESQAIARDVRVDRIGFANELSKQFADKLKADVKTRMAEEKLELVEGEYFEGKFVQGTVGTVDPRKVYRLIKSGKLSESQFLECVRVDRGKLEQYLAGKDIDRLSDFSPATPQLRVTRKKGVEVKLVDALKGLNAALAE
jgi:hypothetical protein